MSKFIIAASLAGLILFAPKAFASDEVLAGASYRSGTASIVGQLPLYVAPHKGFFRLTTYLRLYDAPATCMGAPNLATFVGTAADNQFSYSPLTQPASQALHLDAGEAVNYAVTRQGLLTCNAGKFDFDIEIEEITPLR